MKYILIFMLLLALMGCSQISTNITEFDEDYHKSVLQVARMRMKYCSCDIGLIDGLGLASVVDFPIKNQTEVKALFSNPAISIALTQIKEIAKTTVDEQGNIYWKDDDYKICMAAGLGARATALSVVDVLKLFPQLSPYLSIFTK